MISSKSPRILLVQLYSNGDCLYATAVARQIKQDYPNCVLTWAIASFCKDIILNNPYVDKVRVVDSVKKNDIGAFRKFRKLVMNEKRNGLWDEVFITSNLDRNLANYDGTIRGMIFRAYPNKITVPIEPVLVLSESEIIRVNDFASSRNLSSFTNVILWEYAPLSGQVVLDKEMVMRIASQLTELIPSTCVILSSASSFTSSEKIIDASSLTVRENAALSHYCNLLIGCSSGLTWVCTSSAGKFLPMIQLLDPSAIFRNITSIDFKRQDINFPYLIELFSFNELTLIDLVIDIYKNGFSFAKNKYNESVSDSFNSTRVIVYNLLCYLQFRAIIHHASVMYQVYGFKIKWIINFILGFITSPIKLVYNFFAKRG